MKEMITILNNPHLLNIYRKIFDIIIVISSDFIYKDNVFLPGFDLILVTLEYVIYLFFV